MREEITNAELYSRGRYRLEWDRRADGSLRTPYLQIVWYDDVAGRNRSRSTGTADQRAAEDELDKWFLKRDRGQAVCPTCGQPRREGTRHLVTTAIADYLVARETRPSIGAIRPRLAHVTEYLHETDRLETACEDIDEDWIDTFRDYMIEVPIVSAGGRTRDRAPGTVEASVRQLAAAINFAYGRKDSLFPAGFAAKSPDEVSRTPFYRADISTLAAMFAYCVAPERKDGESDRAIERKVRERAELLAFLRISVATWARPDAAHDVSTDRKRDQWHPRARALNLNPKGRPQTKKYRPIVPAARQIVPLLNATKGFVVTVDSVTKAFQAMQKRLDLPGDGESGMKLIRRSIAHLARKRLGERDWIEGQIMLGHKKGSTSDTYAPFEAGYLGRALEVTEAIIDEIETLVPGAFTGVTPGQPNTATEVSPVGEGN